MALELLGSASEMGIMSTKETLCNDFERSC
jgi:hypothetical protein